MSWEPPAGVPWLVWILIVLLFGPPALGSRVTAKIPGILGAGARWWQDRKAYAVAADRTGRLTVELDALRQDWDRVVPELHERLTALESELTEEKRRFWAAVGYIRQLVDALRKDDPDVDIPSVPDILRDIV